jgi:hypothetical protein
MDRVLISSGENRVLATGSVFAFKNEPITLRIERENTLLSNTLVFKFLKDDKDKKSRMSGGPIDDTTLSVELINFESVRGIGPKEPFAIGENDDAILFLMLKAQTSSDGAHLLDFTLFEQPKKKVLKKNGNKKQ